MFFQCQSLTTLDVSSFNTSSVTDMNGMFQRCSSLTAIDVSGFDTQNVTDMGSMFSDMRLLTSLDVSNFNTANVTAMYNMFNNCLALQTIYVGNQWSTDAVTNSNSMFTYCTNLVGGAGTAWSSSNPVDKTYAHVDAANNPGYFTYKADFQIGDVNGDGSITIADVTALVNIILGKDTIGQYNHAAADVNRDNSITIADVTALVNIILGK